MAGIRTRAARLEARATPEQKALIEEAANLQGQSVTDFVLAAAQDAARRVIEEERVLHLSAEGTRAFAAAFRDAPDPAPALVAAGQLARNLIVRDDDHSRE
jgi:uncharacterized protein (DUF1778 family)